MTVYGILSAKMGSLARSMRDDFGIAHAHAVEVALTRAQIDPYNVRAQMTAKESSSRIMKFTDAHGHQVYELEALPPLELQKTASMAAAFNAELAAEKEDAAFIAGVRRTAHCQIGNLRKGGM